MYAANALRCWIITDNQRGAFGERTSVFQTTTFNSPFKTLDSTFILYTREIDFPQRMHSWEKLKAVRLFQWFCRSLLRNKNKNVLFLNRTLSHISSFEVTKNHAHDCAVKRGACDSRKASRAEVAKFLKRDVIQPWSLPNLNIGLLTCCYLRQ